MVQLDLDQIPPCLLWAGLILLLCALEESLSLNPFSYFKNGDNIIYYYNMIHLMGRILFSRCLGGNPMLKIVGDKILNILNGMICWKVTKAVLRQKSHI